MMETEHLKTRATVQTGRGFKLRFARLMQAKTKLSSRDAFQIIPHAIAAVLLLTAMLKLVHLLASPMSPAQPDPVVGLFTARESMLLGAVFELIVSCALLRSRDLWRSGCLIVYFSGCMTIYQAGLLLAGNKDCACLGAAGDWLGNKITTLLSRLILLTFLLCGLFLIKCGTRRSSSLVARNSESRGTKMGLLSKLIVIVPVSLLVADNSSTGTAAIQLDGLYSYNDKWRDKPVRETQGFQVLMNKEAILITSTPQSLSPRYPVQGCTNTTLITKDVFLHFSTCSFGLDQQIPLTFERAAYPWDLGNCAATLESCVFLALRANELFPRRSGTRRISPPWTTAGEPLGLILEAQYSWSEHQERGGEMVCELVVSGKLKAGWFRSDLASPALRDARLRRLEEGRLEPYTPGFVAGTMRFGAFTNIAGLNFPMFSEFRRFFPAEDKSVPPGSTRNREVILAVSFQRVQPDSSVIGVLPIAARKVFVTDHRLFDHRLGITFAQFETNSITSLAISPAARQDFEARAEKGRRKARLQQLQRVFFSVLAAAVILGPIIILYISRKRGN